MELYRDTSIATYEGANKICEEMKIDSVSREKIANGMGMSFNEIAQYYMPKLDKELREQIIAKTREIILEKGANVYNGVNDVIINLSKNYKLGIVTNNNDEYVKAFLKVSNLENYFSCYMGAASYKMTKSEAIKKILNDNNITKGIYVGDTKKDMLETEKAGLYLFMQNMVLIRI